VADLIIEASANGEYVGTFIGIFIAIRRRLK
jgi:hypothetical protein